MKLALQSGTLLKRYKRFLADIELDNGEVITIHCPNTGAMTGCADAGNQVYFSSSDNPKRKYPNTWEISVSKEQHWICVNTNRANQVIKEALDQGLIDELANFPIVKAEVKYGENSRADFLVSNQQGDKCYVEVKSVTLLEDQQGYFPDAQTTRGQKHLQELIEQVKQGNKACLLFCVQHTGIQSVKAAVHIDAKYAELLAQAQAEGVQVIAYNTDINADYIRLKQAIPVI